MATTTCDRTFIHDFDGTVCTSEFAVASGKVGMFVCDAHDQLVAETDAAGFPPVRMGKTPLEMALRDVFGDRN